MNKTYALKKKGYNHKKINKRNYAFEAFLYGIAMTLSTATLGIVTVYSPNFEINYDLVEDEKKIHIAEISELSKDEFEYYINKTKDYYLKTPEGRLEMKNGTAFINYDLDTPKSINDEVEETYEEKIIKKYCAIYQVDYNKVYNKLSELTDNFTSEEYLNGTIPGITLKKEQASFTNYETLLLVAIRCCKQTPEVLGLSDINTGVTYETDESILDQISYYSELFGTDRKLAYAIVRSENSLGSDFTSETNNFPSIKFEGEFVSFDNPTESIIELCTELYKYNRNGIYSIDEIALTYAPLEDDNENWLPNVKACYLEAEEAFRENEILASNKNL